MLAAIYLAVNVLVFGIFAFDKLAAVRKWRRVPEKTLLLWAIPGAPLALLAISLCRHKINKPVIYAPVTLLVFLHGAAWYFLCCTPRQFIALWR